MLRLSLVSVWMVSLAATQEGSNYFSEEILEVSWYFDGGDGREKLFVMFLRNL